MDDHTMDDHIIDGLAQLALPTDFFARLESAWGWTNVDMSREPVPLPNRNRIEWSGQCEHDGDVLAFGLTYYTEDAENGPRYAMSLGPTDQAIRLSSGSATPRELIHDHDWNATIQNVKEM